MRRTVSRVDASTASIRIGPVVVQCEGDARALGWLWPQHSAFRTGQHPDITVRIALSETPLMGPSMPTAQRSDNGFELAYHGWRARLAGDHADACIYAGPSAPQRGPRRISSLLRVLTQVIMRKSGIALHGATLAHAGTGWVFVGERGAGKTTLASRYVLRPRLGDDYALLTLSNKGVEVHGTPYTGREGTPSEPGSLSLSALVVLDQRPHLRVMRLPAREAYPLLLEHVIAADMTHEGVVNRMKMLEHLVRAVPVLRLSFRRDDAIWGALLSAVTPIGSRSML